MTPTDWRFDLTTMTLLLATIAVLAGGQVLFKLSANGLQLGDPRTFLSFPLVAALGIYGVATLMWLVVLTRLPLSVAFPFYGLTFLLVPLLAWLFLGEPLRIQTLVGGVVIIIGVAICAKGAA